MTPAMLADGANTPVDQGVSTFLFIGVVLFGVVAWSRLRGRAFATIPRGLGWASGAAAAACLVLALVLPPIIRPEQNAARPSTTGRLSFITPTPGEVFRGNPATVPVALHLAGARVVPFISTHLVPNEGHVHLFLDGSIVSMSFTLETTLQVRPGRHQLAAEFVAVDHGPFSPPVITGVAFDVKP